MKHITLSILVVLVCKISTAQTVQLGHATARVGDTVALELTLKEITDLAAFTLYVDYDPFALEFVDCTQSSAQLNGMLCHPVATGTLALSWFNESGISADSLLATYLQFVFLGDSGAVEVDHSQSEWSNEKFQSIFPIYLAGWVKQNQLPEVKDVRFFIDELAPDSSLVGDILLIDPEKDTLYYEIVSGNDDGIFGLRLQNGRLGVVLQNAKQLDASITNEHVLTILLHDGNPEQSTTFSITIGLANAVRMNIPNVFTPNGDGINDTWEIDFGVYGSAVVRVFSRMGSLIYESNVGYATPWNGSFMGNVLPNGTYQYIIELAPKRYVNGHVLITTD